MKLNNLDRRWQCEVNFLFKEEHNGRPKEHLHSSLQYLGNLLFITNSTMMHQAVSTSSKKGWQFTRGGGGTPVNLV